VTVALGFAKPDAIDNAGMVEFVRNDGVFRAQERFEQPAVGVKARGVKNSVFGAEELAELRFQLFMDSLRAADETHARHSIAPTIERFLRRCYYRRMLGQAQIIISAQVEDRFAITDADGSALRRDDDS